MRRKTPCYKCDKRHKACWDDCEDYISWKKEREYELELIKEGKQRQRETWHLGAKET